MNFAFVSATPLAIRASAFAHINGNRSACTLATSNAFAVRRYNGARMTATSHAPTERRPGSHKGFVEEMRFVAMKLHTKDQAPREGEQEESSLPIDGWYPSKQDFMQFLVDSLHVYTYFEGDLVQNHSMFAPFKKSGLERVEALNTDILYLETEYDLPATPPSRAATGYVSYLKALLEKKPESTLCHWYNYYFAHSAGGRMIGRLMQNRLFDGKNFSFYEWEGDVKEMLGPVRTTIDEIAAEWARDVKDVCLKETGLAFGYSGTILQNLAKDAR